MRYCVKLTKEAKEGIKFFKKAGERQVLNKIELLLEELELQPRKGEGKPKRIPFRGKKYWRRKITDKHRLIYDIKDNIVTVTVIKVGDHYDDK